MPSLDEIGADTSIDLDIRGIRLRARIAGPKGAPVCLLFHGWMDSAGSFDRLVPLLHPAPVRTVALDLRGHGDSSWVGAGGFYHFVEYLADIDGVLDQLGLAMPAGEGGAVLEPVRLVGHSMGASLAMLYAATRPSRISHVAQLDGMPFTVLSSEVPGRLVEYLDDLKSISRNRRTVQSIEQATERLRKASPLLKEDAARLLATSGISPDPAQENKLAWKWDPWLRAHSPLPFTAEILAELLSAIRAKLLILRASATWLPDEPELRARFPTLVAPLSMHTLADTSHHLHIEAPEECARLILASWA